MSLLQAFAQFKRTFVDLRRSMREQVQFPTWIDIGDGKLPQDCIVSDVSDGGARVLLMSSSKLPKEFWLILTKERTRRRYCRVFWRANKQVGLEYLGPIHYDYVPLILN